ncbi:MAG: hypothetical protein M1823_001841 [Watsoniomyces obsoletus]|nr:MAG: hypothetical protein M1823_001841 [Watsoniomyces obsoletus]
MDSHTSDNFQIPVIELSADKSSVAQELVDAAEKYGFIFIRNRHEEIPIQEIENAFDLSRRFFSSPKEEKEKCTIEDHNRGWSAMHSETLDPDHQRIDPASGGQEWFSARHDPSRGPTGSILRFLYYPSITPSTIYDPAVDIRAGAHSDYGSITLLFQRPGQAGLEIQTPTQKWYPVPVYPPGTEQDITPPILINIGDALSYWTNGLLKSTVHRVVTPPPPEVTRGGDGTVVMGEDRFSIAYFCHARDDVPLGPVPSEKILKGTKNLVAGKGEGEGVLTAEEHLKQRLAATYGWTK